VGPLDRYGYQYNFLPVLDSLSAFADTVYLCSTTAIHTHVDALRERYPNLRYIWDERFSFDTDDAGSEVFSITKIEDAENNGLEIMRRDGMDCALHIHINQYVQESARGHLKAMCQKMLDKGLPFEWLYKKHQVGDKLFHAETRLPWIVNLRVDANYVFRADALHHRDGSEIHRIDHADFRFMDHLAVVDCAMELTMRDQAEKTNFIRGYEELTGVAWDGNFDQETYLQYYATKFSAKVLSGERLDATGEAIAAASRDDFLAREILRRYRKPGLKRRAINYFRGQLRVRLR